MSNKRTGRMPPDHPGIVAERSHGMCEYCHQKPANDLHHRRFLSRQGGHNLANLLALCGMGNTSGCHGLAHSGDAPEGLAISRHETRHEAEISFLDVNGKRWWLTDYGKRQDYAPLPL